MLSTTLHPHILQSLFRFYRRPVTYQIWTGRDTILVFTAWGFLDPKILGAKQGRRQDFGRGLTSDKISHMNSAQVLNCNGIAKISVRG